MGNRKRIRKPAALNDSTDLRRKKQELEIRLLGKQIAQYGQPWYTRPQWFSNLTTFIFSLITAVILLRSDAFQAEKALAKTEQTIFHRDKDSIISKEQAMRQAAMAWEDTAKNLRAVIIRMEKLIGPEPAPLLATLEIRPMTECERLCYEAHMRTYEAVYVSDEEYDKWIGLPIRPLLLEEDEAAITKGETNL